MKRLANKIAVIYGAGGIGGAIAKAFVAGGQIQGRSHGVSQQLFNEIMEGMTHVGSQTTLGQLSAAAVFAA